MEKTFKKYVCDECGKSLFIEEMNEKSLPEQFEFEKNWLYLNKINVRNNDRNYIIEEKHFCSRMCLLAFLRKQLPNPVVEKTRVEPVNNSDIEEFFEQQESRSIQVEREIDEVDAYEEALYKSRNFVKKPDLSERNIRNNRRIESDIIREEVPKIDEKPTISNPFDDKVIEKELKEKKKRRLFSFRK